MTMKNKEETIVGIEDLQVECIIGILPQERAVPQMISVDIYVSPELSFSSMIDHIDHALDYRQLAEIVEITSVEGQFYLLEALAAEILKRVFLQFKVRWASIRIVKHKVIPKTARAVVELKRFAEGVK